MKGRPKFNCKDKVKFTIGNREYNGEIYIVDKYGTFDDPSDVSYDILVKDAFKEGDKQYKPDGNNDCLFKHITESLVKLDKDNITKDKFHEFIEKSNNIKIQPKITDELYDIVGTWRMHFDEPIYIIGLSEDKYDFYYIGINNKERKLKFITCLYKLNECNRVSKQWSIDEKKLIKSYVNDYFNYHIKEHQLYLWDQL